MSRENGGRSAADGRLPEAERPYDQATVERLRGSVEIEHTLARRGAERLRDLSRSEPLSRQQRACDGAPDQRRAAPRRPDRARGRQSRDRLVRSDRRRRRGRIRRRSERVRARASADRGRDRRHPSRGPALLGEEVRTHGRQCAAADLAGDPSPTRRPSTSARSAPGTSTRPPRRSPAVTRAPPR